MDHYSIRTENKAGRGVVFDGVPSKEVIHKPFMWYQWEGAAKKLFLIYGKKTADQRLAFMFKIIAFGSKGRSLVEMDIPLPLQV